MDKNFANLNLSEMVDLYESEDLSNKQQEKR